MRRILAALPLLAVLPAAAAETGTLETFGDWVVGCDNSRACTALGLSPQVAAAFAYLKVTREAGAESGPLVSVTILDELQAGGPIGLSLAGGTLPVETLEPEEDGGSFASAALGPVDHIAFLNALLPGETLDVSIGDETVPVSLKGMSAALRYMDAAQERAGASGALVARGERPADTIPGPSPLPTVTALALIAIDVPAERPEGLPERDEFCPEGSEDTVFEAQDGTLLWGVCTSAGAYNLFEDFSIVTDGVARPADLGARGTGIDPDAETGSTLVNAGLTEDGRTIQAFFRGRGLGDCGTVTSWVFDGEDLALVEEAMMGECRGVMPDDWPVLYRAEIEAQ